MKKLILMILLMTSISARADKVFIEPSIFVNMMNSANVEYQGTEGYLRSNDLSYALKFGLHHGHFEYGIESEIYNFTAHLENSSGGTTQDLQISYNSLFFGYEFQAHHFAYIAVSSKPFLSLGGKSFEEDHPVWSLEYSYHIKEWVSLNAKIETASELERVKNEDEKIKFGNLLLVGFSFPLVAD